MCWEFIIVSFTLPPCEGDITFFYTWEEWGTGRLRKLFKVTELINGKDGTRTHICGPPWSCLSNKVTTLDPYSSHYPHAVQTLGEGEHSTRSQSLGKEPTSKPRGSWEDPPGRSFVCHAPQSSFILKAPKAPSGEWFCFIYPTLRAPSSLEQQT